MYKVITSTCAVIKSLNETKLNTVTFLLEVWPFSKLKERRKLISKRHSRFQSLSDLLFDLSRKY